MAVLEQFFTENAGEGIQGLFEDICRNIPDTPTENDNEPPAKLKKTKPKHVVIISI